MDNTLKAIRQALNEKVDLGIKSNRQSFFKEPIKTLGVRKPDINSIANSFYKTIAHWEKSEIFSACEQLWLSGYIDDAFVACNWSYHLRNSFLPEDMVVFDRWINEYITNWDTCDTFCTRTMGAFIAMYPQFIQRLKQYTLSENRWVRRVAAVSLVTPARNGLFHEHVYAIADALLLDADDLVQKGYGWLLKVAADFDRDTVFQYVMDRKAIMPRTALRYAIEKMPQELRAKALK